MSEEKFEFKTEIQELLHLIIHTLYTHREIFLRELISNAVDALSKVQFEALTRSDLVDADANLEIRISLDAENRTLTIEDTGIGMSRENLIRQIGTIAHSGTRHFVEQLKNRAEGGSNSFIGQFGVGFYSVFMVADRVRIETRSCLPEEAAVLWESDGSSTYTVCESQRSTRGTTITLHLKADMDEYLEDYRIRSLVQKYSNYLPFPILLAGERINQPTALWRQAKKDITAEQYTEFYKQIGFDFQDPLHWEHIESEAPVQFRALIYLPRESPFPQADREAAHGLKLYAQRVFIQDECKALLPGFLRFLKGVVESEDIPLNVSRETVQNDANIQKINKIITKRVLEALAGLAEKKGKDYQEFWQQYGRFLKEGLSREFAHRDKILPLLRFHSSREDEATLVGLQQYIDRKVEGQQAIYYLYGENMAQLKRSPHLEALRGAGMEVLLIDDPMDDLILSQQPPYEGMSWLNAESADLKIPEPLAPKKTEESGDGELGALAQKVKSVLQDRVDSVAYTSALQDSPCRFVNTTGGVSHAVRKMMISMGKSEEVLKRDLELNPNHALIQRLAQQLQSPEIEGEIKLLYHLACLLEGEAGDPRELADLILGTMKRTP